MDASLSGSTHTIPTERSGFWRRFVAMVVDGIVLGVVETILRIVVGADAASGLGFLIGAAYYTYFHGSTGQTPGDAALSIRVIDLRDGTGAPIGYGRAFVRWAVSIVSAAVILIGFLWMLWDSERQTWHDKAAGSVVVPSAR